MSLRAFIERFQLRQIVLRVAAVLVPRPRRADWLAEWQAELWYVEHGDSVESIPVLNGPEALIFCLGAFKDVLWLRLNEWSPKSPKPAWLTSPSWCISLLAILALAGVVAASQLPTLPAILSLRIRLAHFFLLLFALALLPATTSLNLGEYPKNHESATRLNGLRRWMFFGIKTSLLVVIVFCLSLGVAGISVAAVHPHGALVGYILAFRWSLIDQRRRCPVCLRLLTNPTRIGGASHTFLEWYGTELVCGMGHGLLHVSEIETSSYSAQRWLNLDSSWSGLFPTRRL